MDDLNPAEFIGEEVNAEGENRRRRRGDLALEVSSILGRRREWLIALRVMAMSEECLRFFVGFCDSACDAFLSRFCVFDVH